MKVSETPYTYNAYRSSGYTVGGYPDDSQWYVKFEDCQKLENAIMETINENLHLADGDNCVLIHLKNVLGLK